MKRLFEYFYYRIAKLNFKKDHERAIISVSITQTMIILNILMAIVFSFSDEKRRLKQHEILIIFAIFFALQFYNERLYKGKYQEFHLRWRDEHKKWKTINLILVLLLIVFSWGMIFINAYIFNRFK